MERTSAGYTFTPQTGRIAAGVIIYPGGRVDARSYATLARALAKDGNLAVITPVRLSLAVLSPNVANRAIAENPEIDSWIIVGHSLGGAMAARYAHNNQATIDGLVLLAAYPESGIDMSDDDLAVANLLGSLDTVVDEDRWEDGSRRLPPDTLTVIIDGGNHAGFGDYGDQRGDTPATAEHIRQIGYVVGAVRQLRAQTIE